MKVFLKNAIIKKILIVFITIIMTSNFIMPNYVHATVLDDAGNTLVSGFFQLLAYVGDVGISAMQRMMMGTWDIEEYGKYEIKYSPGMIFANEVPALSINFINDDESVQKTITRDFVDVGSTKEMEVLMENVYAKKLKAESVGTLIKGNYTSISGTTLEECGISLSGEGAGGTVYSGSGQSFTLKYKGYLGQYTTTMGNWWGISDNSLENILNNNNNTEVLAYIYDNDLYIWEGKDTFGDVEWKIYRYDLSTITEKETVDLYSTAGKLRTTISRWYNALRTIALVGLLSALVYIGIRIILSSTSAQDKAKYKNMLKDWLVAICILFVLHYIMAFMLHFTGQLNGIIVNNVIEKTTSVDGSGNNVDKLISKIRNDIGDFGQMGDGLETAGNTIMYLALVILTGVFTIQYLKRVVFMAFLTMVAPLIALTYPIDKVKDGKAQAFSYWLREYIFNCLIQPVHLLIYTVLIVSAFEFAQENILYSIAALAFMVPAEKFIKEMFGMKSQSPTGTLGAAAGGAMVMSMLNKIKSKPPKDDAGSGGASNPSGVRTRTVGGAAGSDGPGGTGGFGGSGNSGNSRNSGNTGNSGNSGNTGNTGNSGKSGKSGKSGNSGGSKIRGSSTKGHTVTGWNKVGSYVGKGFKVAGKTAGGALLGAATGTVALAAQVADGDLFENTDKALGQVALGAGIGYAAGSNLAGKGIGVAGKAAGSIRKAMVGAEAYNNREFDKKIYQSDGYKMIEQDATIQKICRDSGVSVQEATQAFLDQGITDTTKIREALQNGISGDTYYDFNKAGVESAKDMAKLQKEKITPSNYKVFKDAGLSNVDKIASLKKKGYTSKEIFDRASIAKVAKDRGWMSDKATFVNNIKNNKTLNIKDEKMLEDLFDELENWS